MTTSLSKAESNALAVSYEVLGTHVELDLDFVKKYLVRGRADLTSDQEVVFFMNTCRAQKLNPTVQGEVYLIKYSKDDPAQMVVGKDAYLRRAFDHPDYLGKTDGITVKRGNECVQKEGCCLYPGEELIGGWCRVYFMRAGKERTAYKEVSLSEYNKGMANWKSKPATMINKVAVSQCVRDAFPKDYEGIYSEDEMVASGAIPVDYKVVDDGEPPKTEAISQELRQEMFKKAQSTFGKKAGNELLQEIVSNHGLTSTTGMPVAIYEDIMSELDEKIAQKMEAEKKPQQEAPQKPESDKAPEKEEPTQPESK